VKKGIVLELDEEFVTLLTPEGEFIQVRKEDEYEIGEEIEARVMKKPIVRRRSFRYVITSLVAAATLLVAVLFHVPSNEVYAYMSIDINPSIEVGVDEQLKVLKLTAYNKEGKKIISQLSHWKKKAFVDITKEIIELSMKEGYLQKGGQVLITTVERKHRAASSRELSTELTKIQHSYQPKNIIVKTEESTMEVRNKAVKKGMTTGKLLQIEQKISPKAKKLEKPLKQNNGKNNQETNNYWLNEEDGHNHEKNNGHEKNKQKMNNHSLNEKEEKNSEKNKNRGHEKNGHQTNDYWLNEREEQNYEKNRGHEKNKHQTNHYWLNEKEEQNYEKNEQQMINYPLQKKDQAKRKENNRNKRKEMQQNHYPSKEKDEQKQKKR
jgi:hypothetical protein